MRSINLRRKFSPIIIGVIILLTFSHFQAKAESNVYRIESKYNVKIDSFKLQATPYKQILKDGIIFDEEKKIEWYNNITIYEIQSTKGEKSGKGSKTCTIHMIPEDFSNSPVDSFGKCLIWVCF
ncbi:MAG: hypothetical protein M9887_02890 [Chitinophagales bacterium]|nr:hypothetical protein [Chitinophagales bacterium]